MRCAKNEKYKTRCQCVLMTRNVRHYMYVYVEIVKTADHARPLINSLCKYHINSAVRPNPWALLEARLISCRKMSGKPILTRKLD